MAKLDKSAIVVGGGWAGLSCAVQLSQTGHQVTLLESARQLGGRARRVPFDNHAVDNGQHVLIGAYRETLALFKKLELAADQHLYRTNLDLFFHSNTKKSYRLQLPNLLTPLNLFVGLFKANGFRFTDKWNALRFGFKLFTNSIMLTEDISVKELLTQQNQTPTMITVFWEPICLASLNTPIEQASARIFIRVLHDTFCRTHKDADMIIPRVDLGALLPDPAFDFIEQHHGNVHLSQRVTELIIKDKQIVGVKCEHDRFEADHVILATPPYTVATLAKAHPELDDLAYNLSGFNYNPICTIYLKYPDNIRCDQPIQALLNTHTQWLIDRHIAGSPGLMAAVISGPGEHMQWDNQALIEKVSQEVAQQYPHWPAPLDSTVIREKRATFDCCPTIDILRPPNQTSVQRLWLAGDYTQTGYPATLESAILSGQHAATLVSQHTATTIQH